ncbi:MAG TPA: putative metal-binding motif-containing protein, partial [Archangium sp.]
AEVCNNGLDENCNGTVDDPMACGCNSAIDNDFDGANQCVDCRDTDGTIFPGAVERCNGRDDDCDGAIDETFDADGDGFTTCGTVPGGGLDVRRVDCNDANAFVFPLKTTDCGNSATINNANNVDDNCNGYTDETCGCQVSRDRDGDGSNECVDCNDQNATIYPGAPEVCNGVDNDCDRRTVDNCGVSDPCGFKSGNNWFDFPAGTDQCRPDLICVSNVSTGARTCGSFCNASTGSGLNDSCSTTEGCFRNLVDSDNLHLCTVLSTGSLTTGQTCTAASACRTGDCLTGDGATAYCSDKCTHEASCSANTTCHVQRANIVPGPSPQPIGSYYYSFCRLDSRITSPATKNTGDTCVAGECRAGTDMCVNGRCAEPCCQHADCPTNYSCSINGPRVATGYASGGASIDSVMPACTPSGAANRVSGAACTANNQCRSGICDRNLNICIDLCCNTSSCANGTTCQPVNFRFATGALATVRACVFSPVPARIEQR